MDSENRHLFSRPDNVHGNTTICTLMDCYIGYSDKKSGLFHRRTRASYVYNVCLAWYNVVLTPRIHSSVKFVGLPLATRVTME